MRSVRSKDQIEQFNEMQQMLPNKRNHANRFIHTEYHNKTNSDILIAGPMVTWSNLLLGAQQVPLASVYMIGHCAFTVSEQPVHIGIKTIRGTH